MTLCAPCGVGVYCSLHDQPAEDGRGSTIIIHAPADVIELDRVRVVCPETGEVNYLPPDWAKRVTGSRVSEADHG